uniref:Uncharacterized protein n=1 Tax=Phyllostachys edulis TaxID=38705 RepID=D3IVP1_PHYED|nr:hypothetical protein [Phyllostachys edulis]
MGKNQDGESSQTIDPQTKNAQKYQIQRNTDRKRKPERGREKRSNTSSHKEDEDAAFQQTNEERKHSKTEAEGPMQRTNEKRRQEATRQPAAKTGSDGAEEADDTETVATTEDETGETR